MSDEAKALFGTGLTMADGVLTAAVSVTSAVGGIGELLTKLIRSAVRSDATSGIAVAKPSVANHVIAISIVRIVLRCFFFTSRLIPWQAFLLALFLSQPLGTARLSFVFAPSTHATLLSCSVNSPHKVG